MATSDNKVDNLNLAGRIAIARIEAGLPACHQGVILARSAPRIILATTAGNNSKIAAAHR